MAGASIKIIGLPEVQKTLDDLAESVTNPDKHLRLVAVQMKGVIKKNFSEGGRPTKWKAKKTGEPSHLIATGRMRSSINSRVANGALKIGTSTVQGAIHQFGGYAGRNHASQIPARPYLVIPEDDQKIMVSIIVSSIKTDVGL